MIEDLLPFSSWDGVELGSQGFPSPLLSMPSAEEDFLDFIGIDEDEAAQQLDLFGQDFDDAVDPEPSTTIPPKQPQPLEQPAASSLLAKLIPSVDSVSVKPRPETTTSIITTEDATPEAAETHQPTKRRQTRQQRAPLVNPEEGGDLFCALLDMECNEYPVPKLLNPEAKKRRAMRKFVLFQKRLREKPTASHYPKRVQAAKSRKRKGGRFEKEGKLNFVAVSQLR